MSCSSCVSSLYKTNTISLKAFFSVGILGNTLVLIVILKKKEMRTARNVFIVNLALSDLGLCVITMPLTMVRKIRQFKSLINIFDQVDILFQHWQWGDSPLFCHIKAPNSQFLFWCPHFPFLQLQLIDGS